MMKFLNTRVRAVAAAGTALVVIAAIGIGVANSSSAASARFVTATVGTGDVVQTYTATGTISRDNTQAAAFTVDGTVKSVAVAVGDSVDAGDKLASLKTGPLKLAVLNAETAVAQAKASLYAAENPTSTSSRSGSGSGSGSGAGSGSGSGGTTVTIDPVVLTEAASRINLAVLDEAQKCEPVFGSILPAPEPSPTATPTATASPTATETATATPSATQTPTETATATPTATETTADANKTTTQAAPEPTTTASQLEALEANDPTATELQECANARAEVLAANANLQTVVTLLTTPRPSIPTTPVKKASSSSSSSASSSNERAVASAKADLLKANQDLQAANDDLDAATLVAPISGTVGVVGLTKGDSASSGSITIVGSGNAVVTFELPLKTRSLVSVGQEVKVTAAGSSTALTGKLTAISSLETSGTSGSTTTYATTVAVSDADELLATGAKASVAIPVKSATAVVRVPASAVTPTGTGTATVAVLASATAETTTTVNVKTGTVGGGWVEITEGLEAGKLVVLADRTADIPTNATRRRTTTTSTSSSSASAAASASAEPSSGATSSASAQPTASATK